jgi:hypothetical protein
LADIKISHFVKNVFVWLLRINDEGLTLPVEKVDFIQVLIVETLVRKVLLVAVHLRLDDLTDHLFLLNIVDEVIVGKCKVMEKANKHFLVSYKTADYIRVREILICHGPVIYAYELINV